MVMAENTPQVTMEPSTEKKRKCRKRRTKKNKVDTLIPPISTPKFGRGDRHVAQDLYIAIRCAWSEGSIRRVLLANWVGDCVLDMKLNRDNFLQVREKVLKKIEGKVLIGHGLDHILYCLQIQHPWANLRDGATHLPFMKEVSDPLTVMILPRSIDDLSLEVLNRQLPSSPTSDCLKEEAKACMDLYRAVRYDWESATTKLLQQKERQRGVKLVAPQDQSLLSSVSEDSDEYYSTGGAGPAGFHEFTIKPDKHPEEAAEDQSTQAPTEILQEDLTVSAKEDMSIHTKTSSDQCTWIQQDTIPQDGTKKPSGFWGMWVPKQSQSQESTHPIDADDWLCEENEGPLRRTRENVVQEEDEIGAHLPSGLFGESSSSECESDHERLGREETSHYVEGTDWLEDETGPRSQRAEAALALKFSFFGKKTL